MGSEFNLQVINDNSNDNSNSTEKLIQQQMELHNRIVENISENMENKHNHKRNRKTVEFEIRDAVALKTEIDRGGTELARLVAVVTGKTNGKKRINYVLTCEYGKLDFQYPAEELEKYNGLIEFDVSKINETISLRAAIGKSAERAKLLSEIEVKCDCKGKCLTKKCKCFLKELKCNSHCHGKNSVDCKQCENKDS
jgi:hypothetical protein